MVLPLAMAGAAGKIYKVVLADGRVVYTDTPPKGAVSVEELGKLKPGSTVAMTPVKPAPQAAQPRTPATPIINYRLQVTQPAHETTLRDNQGNVNVVGQITPTNARGSYQLFLNGALAQTQPYPQFQLTNLDRGAHEIQIKLVGETGRLLASSPTSTFYLHKASALNRAN